MVPATDMDVRIAERVAKSRRERAAAEGNAQTAAQKPAGAGKPERPPVHRCDRWATFNAFVDEIGCRLTLADRYVWVIMFRHARNGVCETTVRMLATAANISNSTAQAALNRLQAVGLVKPIWKSRDKSKASKYRVHDRPTDCLDRLPQRPQTVPMVGTVADTNRTD